MIEDLYGIQVDPNQRKSSDDRDDDDLKTPVQGEIKIEFLVFASLDAG